MFSDTCVNLLVLGAKFSQAADCTRIIENDGTSLTLESTSGVQHLAPETRELWEYVREVNTRQESVIPIIMITMIMLLILDTNNINQLIISVTRFKVL